ncbi:MAG: hypothetical protein ACOCYE_02250 [Pseudomonadota bacterium]
MPDTETLQAPALFTLTTGGLHLVDGVPENDLGSDGDVAVDAASADADWYRKVDGARALRGHLEGEAGPPGAPGTALHCTERFVDLTAPGTVPLVTVAPHSWIQSIVLMVDQPTDVADVEITPLDGAEPLCFCNAATFCAPCPDLSEPGASVGWPPFLAVDGASPALRIGGQPCTTGRLRVEAVNKRRW